MDHNLSPYAFGATEIQRRALASSLRNALTTFSIVAELLPRWLPEDDSALRLSGIMQRQIHSLAVQIVALEQTLPEQTGTEPARSRGE